MKKSIQFIILTCTVSWTVAGLAILLGLREAKGLGYVVLGAFYMLLTNLAFFLYDKYLTKENIFTKTIVVSNEYKNPTN